MAKTKKPKRQRKPIDDGTARAKLIEIGVRDEQNPDWRPDREGEKAFPKMVKTAVNVKESAVETLFARRELTQLQKKAADEFREHYEAFACETVSAIDYARDQVDAGRVYSPTTPQRTRARAKLAACRQEVGARNYALLVSVCGQGKALGELYPGKMLLRHRLTAADNLRSALQDVAMMWGLAGFGPNVVKRKQHNPQADVR